MGSDGGRIAKGPPQLEIPLDLPFGISNDAVAGQV